MYIIVTIKEYAIKFKTVGTRLQDYSHLSKTVGKKLCNRTDIASCFI